MTTDQEQLGGFSIIEKAKPSAPALHAVCREAGVMVTGYAQGDDSDPWQALADAAARCLMMLKTDGGAK